MTRSVAAAARGVGMTRAGACRLRPDYRQVTLCTLNHWLETGFVQPAIYRGALCDIRRKADDFAILRLRRTDARLAFPDETGETR